MIKKGEGEDVGLLSGTHVMEGSGRMVVVGVGLNSQVGNIMNLLGATDSAKPAKGKKGEAKPAGRTQSASKVPTDLPKQSARIEDETKPPTSVAAESTAESTQWRQVAARKTDQPTTTDTPDIKEEAPKPTTQGGVTQLADDTEDEGEQEVVNDSKHKCKEQSWRTFGLENSFAFSRSPDETNQLSSLYRLHR